VALIPPAEADETACRLYAGICKTNSLSADMVREFCPEVYDKIFPPFDG
jgi:hypothetical protein